MTKMKPYLDITSGAHTSAAKGMCVMEAVAYFVGEKHTDKPQCTSPTIGKAMISFNDQFPFKDNAERTETLLPLIPVVVGTQTNFEDEATRAFIAADFACHVFAPIAFKAAGFLDWAERLKNLKPVVDKETAAAAAYAANAVYYAATAIAAIAAIAATAATAAIAAIAIAAAAIAAAIAAAAYAANAVYYAATAIAANAAANAASAAANAAKAAASSSASSAASSAANAANAAANAANAVEIHEAIKLAFAEMIKRMSEVGTKKMELSVEARIEFEAACHLAKAHD